MTKTKSCFATLALASVIMALLPGCSPLQTVLQFTSPCNLVNCQALGLVDIAGQQNLLMPDYPDYGKDPTCVIPGFCGPNHWYPFSFGTIIEEEPVTGYEQ